MVRRAVIVMAVVAAAAVAAPRAWADKSPGNCNANDLAVGINRDHDVVHSGDVITYSLSVGNPNTPAPNADVACDYTDVAITFTPPGGQPQPVTTIASLPSNTALHQIATETFTVPTITGPVDLDAWINATGTLHDQAQLHSGSIKKDIGSTAFFPSMALTKTASSAGGVAPQTITYTYALTNTSPVVAGVLDDVPIADPAVSDNLCSPLTYVAGDANGDKQLNARETWTYTCTQTFPAAGCHTNVANATGTVVLDNGPIGAGPASATVCVTAPPPQGAVKGASAKSPKACVSLASTNVKVRAKELNTVRVRVRVNGHNIAKSKVKITGPAGLKKTGVTNRKGIVTFVVRPKRSGRLTIASDQCAVKARVSVKPARRVIAPALPEVTG
jgi:uncharacterized repeat protein (TIGR01451 family)